MSCGGLAGREVWERMDSCIRTAEPFCCPTETMANIINQLYANTKLKKKPKKLGGLRQQNYFSQFSRLKV